MSTRRNGHCTADIPTRLRESGLRWFGCARQVIRKKNPDHDDESQSDQQTDFCFARHRQHLRVVSCHWFVVS